MAITNTTQTTTSPTGTGIVGSLMQFSFGDMVKQALKDNDSKAVELTKKNAANRAFTAQKYADLKAVETAGSKLGQFTGQKTTISALGSVGFNASTSAAGQFTIPLRA